MAFTKTPPNNSQTGEHGYFPEYEPSPGDITNWLAPVLLGIGVLLVIFAGKLGVMMVTRNYAIGSVSWNVDEARDAALTFRFLGAMCFAGGLVERLRQSK